MKRTEITFKDTYNISCFVPNKQCRNSEYDLVDDFLITDKRKQLKSYIISKIRVVRESIKLCSFILTDEEIVNELISAISKRNIAVFVLTQLDDSKFNTSFLSEEELEEISNTSGNIHLGFIKSLYEAGAHVRAAENLHAKYIVFDREEAFITSANITTDSLNKNTELGFVCRQRSTVCDFDSLFDLIFQHGTQYEKFIKTGKGKQWVVKTDNDIRREWFPITESSSLKFTFDKIENSIYSEIIRIIEESKTEILLSTYSIVYLESLPEFTTAIKDAIARNVTIKIFCRAMNHRPDHLKCVKELDSMGCQIFGDVLNHAKGVINEKEGLIFTANIDGKHGLKDGFEVGYNLNEEECRKLRFYFEYKISTAPFVFKNDPQMFEVFDYFQHTYQVKNTNTPFLRGDYTIRMHDNTFLKKALCAYPVFIHTDKVGKALALEVGNNFYKVISCKENILEINSQKKSESRRNSRKYILPFQNLQIINN